MIVFADYQNILTFKELCIFPRALIFSVGQMEKNGLKFDFFLIYVNKFPLMRAINAIVIPGVFLLVLKSDFRISIKERLVRYIAIFASKYEVC